MRSSHNSFVDARFGCGGGGSSNSNSSVRLEEALAHCLAASESKSVAIDIAVGVCFASDLKAKLCEKKMLIN